MTHEQMQELTSLRQYKQEIEAYVKRLEDLLAEKDEQILRLQKEAKQIEHRDALIERLQRAAIEKAKAVYEYKLEHGVINPYDVINQWD